MRTATVYNFLIEANLMASLAILLMIPIRRFLRRQLGNRALCFAWLLVAVRLLCPLALPNPWISEIKTPNNTDPVAIRPIAGQVKVRVEDAVWDLWQRTLPQNKSAGEQMELIRYSPVNRALHTVVDGFMDGRTAHTLMGVYLAGAGCAAAWFGVANARFRRRLKKNRLEPLSGEALEAYKALCAARRVRALPVYLTDPLESACLVGVFRPYIALPLTADREQAGQMLTHEICHYKARDHVGTLVGLVCCAAHWFNPLVWLAAAMARTDRELRCDELATGGMDENGRRQYAETLVRAVARRASPGIGVLATGMSMPGRRMKARVAAVLQGGRRVRALAFAFALAASVLLAGAFATAEMPYARGAIPRLGDGGAALREALGGEGAVKTEAEAIRIAQELWRLPALGVDASQAEWSASVSDGGDFRRPVYCVTARQPDGDELICYLYADGGGICRLYNPRAFLAESAEEQPVDPAENYRRELKSFALAFAEAAEPGITAHFTDWQDHGNLTVDGVAFAGFEAWYGEGMPYDSKSFLIQIAPEVRIVEYADGNG